MGICLRNLPWEFAARICRDYLSQEFAVAICRAYLPVAFVSKSFFVYVHRSCLYENKPFLYVSKTFLFVIFSLLTVFLFVIAVAVMGHRNEEIKIKGCFFLQSICTTLRCTTLTRFYFTTSFTSKYFMKVKLAW